MQNIRMISSAVATEENDDVATAQSNYKSIQEVGNFQETEATRPDSDHSNAIETTDSPFPQWNYGDGVHDKA